MKYVILNPEGVEMVNTISDDGWGSVEALIGSPCEHEWRDRVSKGYRLVILNNTDSSDSLPPSSPSNQI